MDWAWDIKIMAGGQKKKMWYGESTQIPAKLYLDVNIAQIRNINSHYNIEIPLYYKRILGEKLFVLIGTSSILNISNTQTSIQYHADGSKKEIHGKTIVLSLGNLIFQEILDLVLTI